MSASIAGWAWVPAPGEVTARSHLQAYLNINRDAEKHPDPILIPFPWDRPEEPEADITPSERAALIESFNKRSAMRDL